MHFVMMHKHDAHTEAGEPPPAGLVERMGAFIGGHAKAGRLVDGAGLGASSTRTRLRFREGRCSIQHGPYQGESELPSRMLLLKVANREQGIGWAERYGKILGDCDIELGKVNEPWDIGLMPAPENPPLQLLLIEKADRVTEGGGRTAKQKAELTRLETEMTKAGVLQRSRSLAPSARAKRLNFRNNDLVVTDGPFTETKELIGGFAVLDLADFDEAIAISRPYAEILGGTLEIDIRIVEAEAGTASDA
jgi:hypothetical protein